MSKLTIVTCACLLSLSLDAQPNILTGNYNNARTNSNIEETILDPAIIGPDSFGKIGSYPVDGHIFAQPLYVRDVAINGRLKNVLYVATMHNSVYAFDADDPQSKEPLWMVNLGPTLPTSYYRRFSDIEREIGILSTPVIDITHGAIYLVTCTFDEEKPRFTLHALNLKNGAPILGGSIEIKASASEIAFDPIQHLQRPGLLLANNAIYIAFGSHNDQEPFFGWILAYDASNIQRQLAVFNASPDSGYGGIWHSGRGLAADSAGHIYASTGNGEYNGTINFSQSILKLTASLGLVDWFTPENWLELSADDADLSSLGPVLVPGTDVVLGGDKSGNLYVLDSNKMGRLATKQTPPQLVRPVDYGGIYNMAIWPQSTGAQLYLTSEGDKTSQFQMTGAAVDPIAKANVLAAGDAAFQGMAVSANGDKGGILWLNFGDYGREGVPAVFCALDASDISNILWCSHIYEDRDAPGRFAKFATPTVVNGRVYLPTFSYEVAVYGLLPEPTMPELLRRKNTKLATLKPKPAHK